MSTSTISSPAGVATQRPMAPRSFGRRLSQNVWRALTPTAAGPVRGRTLEGMRRVMESRLDARRLRERLPELADHGVTRERHWAALLPVYRRFVSRVAPPDGTTSMELAGFLSDLCERRRPTRILEVGTGFASVVLRRVGARSEVVPEIWSVDDEPTRLAQTSAFLTAESLATTNLVSWCDFAGRSESGFDVVVHALGATPGAPLAAWLDRAASGGLLVLDGAHRPVAERDARRHLAAAGAELFSLRALTRDCFGRHALLAVPA